VLRRSAHVIEGREGGGMTNLLGKRYACDACDAQLMVVKTGDGTLTCHGKPMSEVAAKQLPSSD
jgi:hypothetical protein